MKKLNIGTTTNGKTLWLPIDAVTQVLALIGRRGSGKTYGATKLAELFHSEHAQFVAIDPVGVWFSLRTAGPGQKSGLDDVVIFGGLFGDMPILPTAGALIADVIVDRGISAVVDVSQFESDADKTRFARDFAARFYFLKKSRPPSPVHIFIEECQEFIPQNIQRGEEQMLHVWQRLIRLGRNFGIGVTMISQRPQDVNKKALNQAECVFAFQLTGPQERKAIRDWISDKGLDEDLVESLPNLKQGHAHVWSPVWLDVNEEITVAEKKTLSAGGTPIVGERPVEARPLAQIDLKNLEEAMSKVSEESKANDPRALKAEVARLKAELAKKTAPSQKPIDDSTIDRLVKKALEENDRKWQAKFKEEEKRKAAALKTFAQITEASTKMSELLKNEYPNFFLPVGTPGIITFRQPTTARPITPYENVEMAKAEFVKRSERAPGGSLLKCERAILTVLAQLGDCKKQRVAMVSGYSVTSGGFNNSLSKLRTNGFMIGGGDSLSITPEGAEALGEFDPLPTGGELHRYWVNKLAKCEGAILAQLIGCYPGTMHKAEIADVTGYQASSGGFNNSLSRLRTLELIEGKGDIRASDSLFN